MFYSSKAEMIKYKNNTLQTKKVFLELKIQISFIKNKLKKG